MPDPSLIPLLASALDFAPVLHWGWWLAIAPVWAGPVALAAVFAGAAVFVKRRG